MASRQNNPSRNYSSPSVKQFRIGIVVSEFNSGITEKLFLGAKNTLLKSGMVQKNIFRINVPGAFELPLGAQWLIENKNPDAVICLGCIIRGETKHDRYISRAVSEGIMNLNLKYNLPVLFGVLTAENEKQARERSGGKFGNKGVEAAFAAIKMANLKNLLR